MDVMCDCKNFEFRGILCAHALRVFWVEETTDVPEKYLLNRWRKDIPRKYLKDEYPQAILTGKTSVGFQRYEAMHNVCDEICVLLMNNCGLYEESLANLQKFKSDLKAKTDSPDGISSEILAGIGRVYRRKKPEHSENREEEAGNLVKDPTDKRGRGAGQRKRKKSSLEVGSGRGRSRGKGKRSGPRGKRKGSAPSSTAPNNGTHDHGLVSGENGGGQQIDLGHGFEMQPEWINLSL